MNLYLIIAAVIGILFFETARAAEEEDCTFSASYYRIEAGKVYFYFLTDTPEVNENPELSGADSHSFRPILNPNSKKPKCNVHFGKDKKRIYFERSEIKLADHASFEILSNFWSKDHFHVYYKEKMVELADPASSKLIDGQLIDKNYKFEDEQPQCKLDEKNPHAVKICS